MTITLEEIKQIIANIDNNGVYEHFDINSPFDVIKALESQVEIYSDLTTDAEGAIAEIEAGCDELCPHCKGTFIPFTIPSLKQFNDGCNEVKVTQEMINDGIKLKLCHDCFYAPEGA